MRIEQIMTRNAHCCRAEEPLSRAAQLMWEHDCGSLPVVDAKGAVIGMITDRDVCMAAFTQGRAISQIPIGSAMARKVIACKADDQLTVAEKLMSRHQIRRVPVVDGQNQLVGILSLGDLAREAEREREQRRPEVKVDEVAATLAAVCHPRNGHGATPAS